MKMIDFHRGWRYGFPKPIPDFVTDYVSWAISEGLPEEFTKLPFRIYEVNFYKLTKIAINEGAQSMVQVGESVTGDLFRITDYTKPNEEIKPDEIEEGQKIMVQAGLKDWISTSPIKRVVENNDESWTITTQTSTYSLERK